MIEHLYRRAGVRAQVPKGALVHALRHTFATQALEAGASVVEVKELLGHESLDTTKRYRRPDDFRERGESLVPRVRKAAIAFE